MNFTREPIIETILSPKDGCKLCIKNSKIAGAEELFVDAVEVVSFGQAFFFRSQERPKPFLVPVSDYEVFEVKETRVVLKNITHERNIKINGGKEAAIKPPKEIAPEKVEELDTETEEVAAVAETTPTDVRVDKKRDRRRNRRKRMAEERKEVEGNLKVSSQEGEEGDATQTTEARVTSAMFTHLLPPPPTLISETLSRLREKEAHVEMSTEVGVEEDRVMVSTSPEQESSDLPKGEDFFS